LIRRFIKQLSLGYRVSTFVQSPDPLGDFEIPKEAARDGEKEA
jgi:hypothetical protein